MKPKIKIKKPFPKSWNKMSKADRAEYEKNFAEELAKKQPLIDAANACGRITAEDLNTRIG